MLMLLSKHGNCGVMYVIQRVQNTCKKICIMGGASAAASVGVSTVCKVVTDVVTAIWDYLVEESRGNRLNSFCLLYSVPFMSFMFSSCKYSHPFVFSFDLHPLFIVNNHIFSTSIVNIAIFM